MLRSYPSLEVAEHIHNKLKAINDLEEGTDRLPSVTACSGCRILSRRLLKRVGEETEWVSEANRQRLQHVASASFHRKSSQSLRYSSRVDRLRALSALLPDPGTASPSLIAPQNEVAQSSMTEQSVMMSERTGETDPRRSHRGRDSLPRSAVFPEVNPAHFKTPLNTVIADQPDPRGISSPNWSKPATLSVTRRMVKVH